ncbi:MAG: hypothetical protein P4L00_05835 [Candidatus Acidoferrales bacterium]|nr:hypothetical protein [Candidatus Acidoferrales bacterium]
MSGQIEDGQDRIVDAVWSHFLFERLKPYIESGAYKNKSRHQIAFPLRVSSGLW